MLFSLLLLLLTQDAAPPRADRTPAVPQLPADPTFRSQVRAYGSPRPPRMVRVDELRTVAAAAAITPALADDEFVVGLALGDEARAWPIDVLSHAEALNDRIGGVPVAITWCVMCQTAIVYRRTIEGKELTIGNTRASRLNNLLLYDLETGSIWQQVNGQALHGEHVGRTLEAIPTRLCTWGAWKRDHPDTRVVLDQVDAHRVGKRFRAFQSVALPYMGLAVRIGSEVRYYPLRLLEERGFVEDEFEESPLVVVFVRERRLLQAWRRPGEPRAITFDLERLHASEPVLVERGGGRRWDAASGRPLGDAAGAAALEPLLASPITSGRYTRLWPEGSRFGPSR